MDDLEIDIHELNGRSPEFRTDLAKQLEDLIPEAIADGKVDAAKLKELLQEDAGDTNERFGLFWPGKKRAMRAAQEPTTATLKPAKELSKDWDTTQNIFIEGDNLEVLKVLQKQYHNAIKMIYIDPPYNTGKDFVYPDNFQEGLQNYLEFSKQVDEGNKKISTNTETAGRYHSNWLNMMYPRLKLARNLLTDDGVIFISIDDNESDNVKKLCNEIFGEDNLVAELIVVRAEGGGLAKQVIKGHDYLFVYCRNVSKFKPLMRPKDIRGKVVTKDDGEEYWIEEDWLRMEFGKYGTCTYEDITKYYDEKKKQEIDDGLAGGKYTLINKNGKTIVGRYRKISEDGSKFYSILRHLNKNGIEDIRLLSGLDKYFDFPKPVSLVKEAILGATFASKKNNDIILDFFSGSGTTAHAVMQLNAEDGGNRKHIQVQLPEPTDEKSEAYKAGYRKISDIARERINRAGEKIAADFADKLAERNTPLDIGYRTYQLSETNFRKWQSSATNDLGELQARLDLMRESADDNASEEDLLVEVMLKMGLPLTNRTASREVAGLTIHQVAHASDYGDDEHTDVQPVFYLNEHVKPTLEQLRVIVTELTPSKFVILDDAFQGDNELKTNLVQTCKSYDIELWTV